MATLPISDLENRCNYPKYTWWCTYHNLKALSVWFFELRFFFESLSI